jgi:hypothetical protein
MAASGASIPPGTCEGGRWQRPAEDLLDLSKGAGNFVISARQQKCGEWKVRRIRLPSTRAAGAHMLTRSPFLSSIREKGPTIAKCALSGRSTPVARRFYLRTAWGVGQRR